MKKGIAYISFFVVLLGFFCISGAEDTAQHRIVMQVAEFSLLNVLGSPEELSVIPLHPGVRNFQDAVDSSVNLQYSSAVGLNQHRAIMVGWELSGSTLAGCALKLRAVPSGKSNEGSSAGEIVLSSESRTLLSGITSCATGTGFKDGARLVYALTVMDASQLVPGECTTATVTLTLTDVT